MPFSMPTQLQQCRDSDQWSVRTIGPFSPKSREEGFGWLARGSRFGPARYRDQKERRSASVGSAAARFVGAWVSDHWSVRFGRLSFAAICWRRHKFVSHHLGANLRRDVYVRAQSRWLAGHSDAVGSNTKTPKHQGERTIGPAAFKTPGRTIGPNPSGVR